MTESDPYGTAWLWEDTTPGELSPQPAAAAQDRDTGMALALTAHDVPPWPTRAMAWVEALPVGQLVTSEDVTDALGLPRVEPGQHRNNAVGALMRAAATRGLLVRVGYTRAQRKRSRGAVLSQWQRTGVDA